MTKNRWKTFIFKMWCIPVISKLIKECGMLLPESPKISVSCRASLSSHVHHKHFNLDFFFRFNFITVDVMSTWTMLRCKCWDVSSVHLWEHSSPTFGNLKALAVQSIFTWHGKLSWSWNLQHCAWAWKKSEILNLYKCRQPSNYIHNRTTWVGKSNHSG